MHVKRDYVSYSEPERETFSIGLTRVCVRSGSLNLPYSLQGRFAAGTLRATDAASGASYALEHEPPRTLTGLAEFFEASGLKANDLVILHLEGDRVELEAKRFERRPASQRRGRPAGAARPDAEDGDAETVETTPHGTTIRQRRIRSDDEDTETRPAGSPTRTEASNTSDSDAPRGDAVSGDVTVRASSDASDREPSAELGSSWNDDAPTASSWAMAFAQSRSRSASKVSSDPSERQGTVRAVRVSRDGTRVPLHEAPAGADAGDGRFDTGVGMRIAGGATSELADASVEPAASSRQAEDGAPPAADDGFSDALIAGGPGASGRERHEVEAADLEIDPEGAVKDADAWPRAIQKAVFDVVKRGRERSRDGADGPSRDAKPGRGERASRSRRDDVDASRGRSAARADDRPPVWRPPSEQGSLWNPNAPESVDPPAANDDRPQGGLFEARAPEAERAGGDSAAPGSAASGRATPRGGSTPTDRPSDRLPDGPSGRASDRPSPDPMRRAAPGSQGGAGPFGGRADEGRASGGVTGGVTEGPPGGASGGSPQPRPAAERTGAPRPSATAQVADYGPAWLEAFEQEGDLYTRLKWALEHPSMPVIVTRERLAEATEVPADVLKEILDGFAVESPSERFQIQRIGKDAYRVSRSSR